MNNQDIIIQAIKNRNILQFVYKGLVRVVEPFTIGVHKDTGKIELRAYKVGGASISKNEPQWRLYVVAEIMNLVQLNRKASNYRNGYNPQDKDMASIICTV